MVTHDSSTATEAARRSLARFELAATRHRNAMRTRLGLGDDELTTLLYLIEHEVATQREVVEISTLTRSGVGAMVQRLEDSGLIERVPDPRDGRVRLLRLTARGTESIGKARGACDDERTRVLAGRSDAELHALAGLLSHVAEVTERAATSDSRRAVVEPVAQADWRRWG